MKLSWEISDDGNLVEISGDGKELLKISVSEISQASQNKKASKFFTIKGVNMSNKKKGSLRLSVVEAREFCEWFLDHSGYCPVLKEHGEVFTGLTFHVSSVSGIGKRTVVECDCGKEHDITDVASW